MALFATGLHIASQKPLWNDERYSLAVSTLGASYQNLVMGHLSEGNNSPLFYVLQKIQCDLTSFHFPESWFKGEWVENSEAQLFIRVQPVLYVALALAALFYYFSVRECVFLGVYACAIALSSFMLWSYTMQARPYAMLFALTLIQLLFVMEILGFPNRFKSLRWGLIGILVALAFLSAVSLIQVVIVSAVIGLFVDRQWKTYILLTIVPVAICLYYQAVAIKLSFFFADGPLALVNANIPNDRMFILVLGGCYIAWEYWRTKRLTATGKFFIFSCLILAAYAVLVLKLQWTEAVGKGSFQVSNRYFMSLTPVGIIAVTVLSNELIKGLPHQILKWMWVIVLAGLLYFRVKRTMAFGY